MQKQQIIDYINKEDTTYIGILSTAQQVKYGKTKAGKPIYQIRPIKKILPPFWITYGGKLTGKIIIQFKFKDWNDDSKLPFGEIVSVLGNLDNSILLKTLSYHYQVERKDFKNIIDSINQEESNIIRKNLKDLYIFSIDPKGCIDIDDALSIEKVNNIIKIGVHIAQPICWLTKEQILERSKKAFSTLYLPNEKNKNLWSEEITEKASLIALQSKPAYSIIFTIEDNKIINTESFPSIIINKLNTNYDEINYSEIIECKRITEKLINKEIDSHELVSFWMIQTNQFIGNSFDNIPFRSQETKEFEENNLDSKIKDVFKNMSLEGAFYSYDKDYHHSLNIKKYTHFTSPIRRIMDTIIHWNITYPNSKIETLDLEKINILDKKTKKFHQQMNLINIIEKLPDECELTGWIYSKINNKCLVYFEELGFMKVKLWNDKFNYLIKEEDYINYQVGKSYNFKINKINEFLPMHQLIINLIKIEN